MNKVKELIERTRLTPEEKISAEEDGVRYFKDLRAKGDAVYSRDGLVAAIHKFIIEAQLIKALNNPDLALIDRDEMVSTASIVIGTKKEREWWTAGFKARGEICRKTYIPLAQVLKEVE